MLKQNIMSQTTISRVNKVEFNHFAPIVRVPIRSEEEANIYLREGVAVYEKVRQLPNNCFHKQYFIEVSVEELAKIANK